MVTDPTNINSGKYRRFPSPTAKAMPRNAANQKNPKRDRDRVEEWCRRRDGHIRYGNREYNCRPHAGCSPEGLDRYRQDDGAQYG